MNQVSVFPKLIEGFLWATLFAWLISGLYGCIAIHTPIPCFYNGESFTQACHTKQEKGQAKWDYLSAKWKEG